MSNPKSGDEFEIVSSSSIQFVKRGRKSLADPKLIEQLKMLNKGQAMVIRKYQQDPKSATYANDKARVASQIRTACKTANLVGFSIVWSPEGIPQVKLWPSVREGAAPTLGAAFFRPSSLTLDANVRRTGVTLETL